MGDDSPPAFTSNSDLLGKVQLLDPYHYRDSDTPRRDIKRVVVFTAGKRNLHYAVELAAELDRPLDIYHDVPGRVDEEGAYELIRPRLFHAERLAEVPEIVHIPVLRDAPKPWSSYEVFRHPLVNAHPNGGVPDLRSAAAFDGYQSGEDCVVHLDDDVRAKAEEMPALARAMYVWDLVEVGPRISDLRDISIFEQLARIDPQIYSHAYDEPEFEDPPSGGLLLVDPTRFPSLASPSYDEDHINSYRKVIHGGVVAVLGKDGRHYEYPRCTIERAGRQIAGTIICEGYSFACRTRNDLQDIETWRTIIKARLAKTGIISNSIDLVDMRAELSGTDPGISWGDKPVDRTQFKALLEFYGEAFTEELKRAAEYVSYHNELEQANIRFADLAADGTVVPTWSRHVISKRDIRRASPISKASPPLFGGISGIRRRWEANGGDPLGLATRSRPNAHVRRRFSG